MPFEQIHTDGSLEKRRSEVKELTESFRQHNLIDPALYNRYQVKRGLRNEDGTGVVAGLTKVCNVHGYVINEGERSPVDGELVYRGINVKDIVEGCRRENRFGFEEVAWLLLFGSLPTTAQLSHFRDILDEYRELPTGFAEDLIMKAPSPDVMNKLGRSILGLYPYDPYADDLSLDNVMRQSIELIARMPTIMVQAYQVKRRHFDGKSMYIHTPKNGLSTAENILRMLRADKKFDDEEAKLLDLCMMLHAEHGGGNNSTFACRVLSSSGTDTYSAISAAVGALKGPRHGGANAKVLEMFNAIKAGVSDWKNDDEIACFLQKILEGKAGDGSGKIYGMGHAVYTKSDPRAVMLKSMAFRMAEGTEFAQEFALMERVERLSPQVFLAHKKDTKMLCANVDMYSGLVYRMLRIPPEVFTPLFAVSRVPGWCAHRIEEIMTSGRIIRPAYKAVSRYVEYVPLGER